MSTSKPPPPSQSPSPSLLSPQLDWSHPIAKGWVHKTHPESVHIASVTKIRDNAFAVAAYDPPPLTDPPHTHDPVPLIEVTRQAGIAVAHIGYEVVLGTRFVMQDVDFHLSDYSQIESDRPLIVSVTVAHPSYQKQVLRHARLNTKLLRGGDITSVSQFAHGSGFLVCTPEDVFARMEQRLVGSEKAIDEYQKLPPEVVGKVDASDVLLAGSDMGGGRGRWLVVVDPATFNHTSRHLPGMDQVEIFRQAGHALVGADKRFLGIEVKFLKLVHPRAEIHCMAKVGEVGRDKIRVHVEMTNHDKTIFAYGSVWYSRGGNGIG